MTLREGPSKSRWTWRARLVLVFFIILPVLIGLCFGLGFGAFQYVRLKFFLDYSNELSVQGAASMFVIISIAGAIAFAFYMAFTFPRFLRHYGMTMREYCHLPQREMNKLWDEYKS